MPWYTMTIQADAQVPACCVLKRKKIGSLHGRSLASVWYGAELERMRHEMRPAVVEGALPPGGGAWVEPGCTRAATGTVGCPFRNDSYADDFPFARRLLARFDADAAGRGNPPG